MALDHERHAAVLRQPLLGDVEVGHDLHARDDAGHHSARDRRGLAEHAVHAEAHAHLAAAVRLEVEVGGAVLHRLGDDRVDELDDRRVVRGLADVRDQREVLGLRPPATASAIASSRRFMREISAATSSPEATTGRSSWPVISLRSSSASTLDGSAIATSSTPSVEADRHRVVAAGRLRVHEVERADVRLEDREVDVVEAEALGRRARELLGLSRAPDWSSTCSGVRPGRLGLLHRGLHALLGREAELDDHVGDEAAASAAAARRRQPVDRLDRRLGSRGCGGTVAARDRLQVWSLCGVLSSSHVRHGLAE